MDTDDTELTADEGLETEDWPWPFSKADLSAGLRRYYGDPSIWVRDIIPLTLRHMRPSIGRLRAIQVSYQGKTGDAEVQLVVKEPRGTTRTGLAGAGRREVGVYRHLVSELPLATPRLVAASDAGDWLVLRAMKPERAPAEWTMDDYQAAIRSLVRLHDRFWGLGKDLNVFQWLSRPTEADFEVHVSAAANALQRLVDQGQPAGLPGWPDRVHMMANLIMNAQRVIEPLAQEPATLLHGDYWPGNILVLEGGRQAVFDWQLTAVGPAALDLLVFVVKSTWWFEQLPMTPEEIVNFYRATLAEQSGIQWDQSRWDTLWDHALMWRFLQEWLDLLAVTPNTVLETRAELLEELWFEPLSEAVHRRLLGD